ncbi:MAG: cupin domain-containing protein [Candidatus Rokubacteria bacterium]|nr:cupin domain-containing protein [Candidatus Rokubacteria bacterium]
MDIVPPYVSRTDARGLFRGIARVDWGRELNYVESAAGASRGHHYHKTSLELFFILDGEVAATFVDVASGATDRRRFVKGDAFVVRPFEAHRLDAVTDARWIQLISSEYDDAAPDMYPFHVPD